MSNYYEVFQQRCYNRGLSFKEVVQKQAEHSFQRFLKSSPNSVDVRVNNQGNPIRVATILDKENDTLYKRYFLCRNFVGKKKCITFATAYKKHGRLAQLV